MTDFQLVGPDDVAPRLATDSADRWVVLEAHFTSPDHPPDALHPNTQHLPGAIQVHPSYLEAGTEDAKYYPHYEAPIDGNLLPDPALHHALARLGIAPATPVLVYGTEPAGTMAAARLVWGLLYAGVAPVHLLDGGIDAWLAAGQTAVPDILRARDLPAPADRVGDPATPWSVQHEVLATTADVRHCVQGTATTPAKLVDVRHSGEWDGTLTHYYPFFSQAGHIPTAIHQGDWENLIERDTQRIAPMLDAVADRWRSLGIIDAGVADGSTTLIFYCGTGWRSSVAFLVARLLGLRARNYDDGFYGWSWHEEDPIVLGSDHRE